jgi:hypothetical protein
MTTDDPESQAERRREGDAGVGAKFVNVDLAQSLGCAHQIIRERLFGSFMWRRGGNATCWLRPCGSRN